MIVPMKKASLIILDSQKQKALRKLRHLGLMHIEQMHGSGEHLSELRAKAAKLEDAMFVLEERKEKNVEQKEAGSDEAIALAEKILSLIEETKTCYAEISAYRAELERLKAWGEIDPEEIYGLAQKGVRMALYEMPPAEFEKLDGSLTTLVLAKSKALVRFVLIKKEENEGAPSPVFRVRLPKLSTQELKQKIESLDERMQSIEDEIAGASAYVDSIKKAIEELRKDVEFEVYSTGMTREEISENSLSVAYFTGYIQAEDVEKLKTAAKENSWGLALSDPTDEDNVPTRLKNNRFVSLIYPLTDFLGTVPGYFEYDISAWFLGFILVFFGIIFGDGGYGLLICAVAAALILKSRAAGKPVSAAYLLILLLGGATVLWGLLTCTWFGLSPEQLPEWLGRLSVPVISNVYADKIWYPFWTNGEAGLTTAQNVQIFCFSLALLQLTAAHFMSAIQNRKSLKVLGDIGSILQLVGVFYVVLSLVVNAAVFPLSLVIGGVPVGTIAIATVVLGFIMSFVFANYDGSIGASILDSLKNIVSVLLGVVNVFSDIVSYIRLWAVGLAGAAISATVNELAGPMLGNLVFIVFAVILLVFGHGLNMILNVLSVIVHGVRLNTLEFSSHLDMSWSGHKFEPFEE